MVTADGDRNSSSTACRIEEECMNLREMTPLAEGRVSHVYVLKDKRVLKLLHKTVPDWKVDDEFRRCQIVAKASVLNRIDPG
jgi:phosphoribosylaminoimidazole-succinocarboxamide synthase